MQRKTPSPKASLLTGRTLSDLLATGYARGKLRSVPKVEEFDGPDGELLKTVVTVELWPEGHPFIGVVYPAEWDDGSPEWKRRPRFKAMELALLIALEMAIPDITKIEQARDRREARERREEERRSRKAVKP